MKRLTKKLVAGPVIAISMMFSMTVLTTAIDITGTVEKKGGKFVLLTTNDVYVLAGKEDPTDMLGKEIVVTGTVETENEVKVMGVYIYDEAETEK